MNIERKIIISLITSTAYLNQLQSDWKVEYMESSTAKLISNWCWEYFKKYNKAPMRDIETIYIKKLKKGLDENLAEEIESEILPGLSKEYTKKKIDITYLLDETQNYFKERQITLHNETLAALLEKNKVEEAEKEVINFELKLYTKDEGLELSSPDVLPKIETAFDTTYQSVIKFPGALGDFWNDELIRGGFVSILAPEKRGKCLPGNQRVMMSTGEELTINSIIKSGRKDIISYDEKKQKFVKTKIKAIWENGKKEVFKVTTKTGRSVQVTKNHPFLTTEGWKDLTEINVKDFIAVPKKINYFGNRTWGEHKIKLIAYFITEGCLREYNYNDGNGTYINISFTSGEKQIKKDFENCIEKMNCSVSWNGINGTVHNSKENKGKHGCNYVLPFLKKYKLFGKLSYHKTIPKIIFNLPKNDLSLFLRILFTCDGWINEDGSEIGFCAANKTLCYQVQVLLTKFGIVSKITYKSNNKASAWELSMRDYENIILFCKEIGFAFSKQKKAVKAIKDKPIKYKSFLDKFPHQIAQKFHDEVKEELGYARFLKVFTKAPNVREQLVKKKPLMRQSFLEVKNTITGEKYWNDCLLWDEITEIKCVGEKETFDLTVKKHHNFIAENVLVHNTFWLLEFMMKAYTQGKKVAFFQAGDMTESQQIMRTCIYLAKKSNKEQYCGVQYIPVVDCIKNQADTCDKRLRECSFGVVDIVESKIRKEMTLPVLIDLYKENPKYKNCYNCVEFRRNSWGTPWLKEIDIKNPLTATKAKDLWQKFFIDTGRKIKISTHVNTTLTVPKIRSILNTWRIKEKFEPELILVDYADLLVESKFSNERDNINFIWKSLRALSQEGNQPLVIAPTQSDANSYMQDRLNMTNFSEDKRKFAHVTAMYGLNLDTEGREKQLGTMRINRVTVREGDFHSSQEVYVLHRLQIGRPFLGSYF